MDIDSLVREYLLQKGYSAAAEELQTAIAMRRPDDVLISDDTPTTGKTGSDSNKRRIELLSTLPNALSATAASEYEKLRYWAFSSIEAIRRDLMSLSFPLFVQSYITMVTEGRCKEAQAFATKWKGDFLVQKSEEIASLIFLSSPDQLSSSMFLDANKFIKSFVGSKIALRMSRLSYGLLSVFLNQNNMLFLAKVINEKLDITITEETVGDDITQTKVAKDIQIRKRLFTGVFGLGDDSHHVPALFSKDTSGETRCDDYYKDIFNKLARRNIFADSLASTVLEAPAQSLIWPEAAIPPSSISNVVEDAENKCHRENKENDLSVLFATITNTYDGLICMKILPNASKIVCGFTDSCIRLWSSTAKDHELEEHADFFNFVLPAPKDVHGLVQEDMTSSHTSERIDSADFYRKNTFFSCKELRGHSKAVYSLSHDPSGQLLLSTSADETVRLWDSVNARCLTRYLTVGPTWDVDFGPFGFYFALAHQNRTASVYSTDRDVPLRVFCGHESDVTCCRWHPNAAYFLTGSDDRTVRMWDIRAGSCMSEFVEFISPISKITISPDGNYFAAGCENGSIAVLDLRFCRRTAILEGHVGPILDVSFSPDSKSLCSGGDDCTVRIWDISACKVGQIEVVSHACSCFYTKQSQVFTVRYDSANLVYCGGAFSSNNQNRFERQQTSSESDSMNGLGILAAKVSSV